MIKEALRRSFRQLGYEVRRVEGEIPPDLPPAFAGLVHRCRPFTMTSVERLWALHEAVRYVVANGLEGDFVECGVWRGGSTMAMALTLQELGAADRRLHLYDTFAGMSAPTGDDVDVKGRPAQGQFDRMADGDKNLWCYAGLDEVRANLASTGYPEAHLRFMKGKVEETIPEGAPEKIALLRLDTDWYDSTRHELEHLYPRLVTGGVLIIDDYGHWQGARNAVDEYFAAHGIKPLLSRIDYTGRMMLKPGAEGALPAARRS
jgi:O-methyltransferase